ncbi:MAG: TIGR03960 family B12-binding radical SAM protein [Candidatus Omnitrophota bacterium]|nr:TIGR03960 family B12-binding radical SAM protein [Candidatus Omnitrophota bacterium]MBU1928617.1 TIGR03960 family B12-binding radical SAM protein [Candidatus Omnitrophota bacterium]MBU2034765.1 TIGR03960 family B12-binding radical SAM protein [Candidatus Omnitrophota bacterium]MBU2258054.1 TIGR03960 family B12-binding radical SAM protein [Candidatus Omnitrophota bacterium]
MEEYLLQVRRPAQYIGKEWNACKKDFDAANIKFALCFPDLYEVGMSNLGFRIIYDILNKIQDAVCERVFSPDLDMEKVLRENKREIFSLESQRALREFDILGFSLSFELCYTNVLNILDLAGIPLSAALRDEKFPLVIGGGPCVMNPEPIHEFFDLFVLGEAEEVLLEIVDTYRKLKNDYKNSRISKEELLICFSQIEGVYAPALYRVDYDNEGKIVNFQPKSSGIKTAVKKRFLKDLDKAAYPLNWLVPYVEIIHDRITLEVMRGCPNSCRFCQARSQYYPFRQKQAKNIMDLASCIYQNSGYEELSLGGLSVSDYKGLDELMKSLIDYFKPKGISVSLPSIKPKVMLGELSALIASIKKTSLTFAPEAGSEKMRKAIGKDFDADEFYRVMEQAYKSGYQHLKLYFMTGLPNEEDQDLDKIIEFASLASELRRKIGKGPAEVNISINTIIPKPHTAFQWSNMDDLESAARKASYIRGRCRNKRLRLSFHDRYMGFMEGVFSRGDRRLSQVILAAFAKGARFDAWNTHFSFEKWVESFKECGIDPQNYLKERSYDERLPWDMLDTGVSRDYLVQEAKKMAQTI